MKILILINGALKHRTFYVAVAKKMRERGEQVVFALDSHYTDYLHRDVPVGDDAHYFSDYFRSHFSRRCPPEEMRDVNLWSTFFPDADRMMHSNFARRDGEGYYTSLVANLSWFFCDLFDAHKFDAVVYENVSNAFSYAAYEVAKRRGALFIGFTASRMPGRIDVLDRAPSGNTQMEELFWKIRRNAGSVPDDVASYVSDYLANVTDKIPDYMRVKQPYEMGPIARYFNRNSIETFIRSIQYVAMDPNDWFHAFQVPDPRFVFAEQLLKDVWRQAKLRILGGTYQKSVPLDIPYFVYPLQFHPESAASVDGPSWNDEWHNLEQISRSMPFGVQLYVKDHRHAVSKQPLSFYRRVARLPNVTLIDATFDTKLLLRHCKAVVCSTSTMGFEALVMQKPVFVLGNPFYAFVPGCIRVGSFDAAFKLFSKYAELTVAREDIEAFLASYFILSEEGRLDMRTDFADAQVIDHIANIVINRTHQHSRHPSQQHAHPGSLS